MNYDIHKKDIKDKNKNKKHMPYMWTFNIKEINYVKNIPKNKNTIKRHALHVKKNP